jgi:hypothetical protein
MDRSAHRLGSIAHGHVSRAAVPWGCSRSKYGGEVDFDELAVESEFEVRALSGFGAEKAVAAH